MPRSIPVALQGHLDEEVHTLAFLLKVTARNGTSFGVTSHDQPIVFDDGGGALTYSTIIGLDQSSVKADTALEVANSESVLLLVDADTFTDKQIEAGVLDFARFIVYRVNWQNLAQGHYIVQAGTTGAVRNADSMEGVIELRGLTQGLRQTFVELYSITCRAIFGSQAEDEQFPCTFDAEALWTNHTVDSVGAESDRVFVAATAPSVSGPNGALPFVPGLIQFTSGDNNGAHVETEVVSGANIELRFPTAYPIEVGDTFRIRPDCAKRFAEDCIGHFDNALNFRGEPWIPIVGRDA